MRSSGINRISDLVYKNRTSILPHRRIWRTSMQVSRAFSRVTVSASALQCEHLHQSGWFHKGQRSAAPQISDTFMRREVNVERGFNYPTKRSHLNNTVAASQPSCNYSQNTTLSVHFCSRCRAEARWNLQPSSQVQSATKTTSHL